MLPSATSTFLPSSSISIIVVSSGSDLLRRAADLGGLVLDEVDELVAEVLDHRAHRHRRCVAERADGAALDVVGDGVQQFDVFHPALALRDAVDHAPQPAGAFATGRALAAAL